jgi:hypothetical protein
MEVIVALLALIGFVTLVLAAIRRYEGRAVEPVQEVDRAAPYREGLHAAIRMQVVAQELEQQLYAEALRRAEGDSGGKS